MSNSVKKKKIQSTNKKLKRPYLDIQCDNVTCDNYEQIKKIKKCGCLVCKKCIDEHYCIHCGRLYCAACGESDEFVNVCSKCKTCTEYCCHCKEKCVKCNEMHYLREMETYECLYCSKELNVCMPCYKEDDEKNRISIYIEPLTIIPDIICDSCKVIHCHGCDKDYPHAFPINDQQELQPTTDICNICYDKMKTTIEIKVPGIITSLIMKGLTHVQ